MFFSFHEHFTDSGLGFFFLMIIDNCCSVIDKCWKPDFFQSQILIFEELKMSQFEHFSLYKKCKLVMTVYFV